MVLHEEAGKTLGVWPYFKKKKMGVTVLTQPILTPYLGPWVVPLSHSPKATSLRKYRKRILNKLGSHLPAASWIICHCHPDQDNWLPLSWLGFSQTTRYTYLLDLSKPQDELWAGMSDKMRNRITKGSQSLKVELTHHMEPVVDMIHQSFQRQAMKPPFSRSFLLNWDKNVAGTTDRRIYLSFYDDQPVAAVYTISDADTTYLLLTGRSDRDPGGAVACGIWQAIKDSKTQGHKNFDFEGSMIENISFFFDSFGGQLKPYHRLYKTSNRLVLSLLKLTNRL